VRLTKRAWEIEDICGRRKLRREIKMEIVWRDLKRTKVSSQSTLRGIG